jgi:hypothetical protein
MSTTIIRDREADVAIFLEHGVDCQFSPFGQVAVATDSLCFRSNWRFEVGTELALKLCAKFGESETEAICAMVHGVVIACEPSLARRHQYDIALLFVDKSALAARALAALANRPELMGNYN